MKKTYLLTPGPTPVPPDVLLEMAEPMIHHRTKEYQAYFQEATRLLQLVFQTQREVLTLTSSGTGAMEAAVANLLVAGQQAIVVRGGKFGERWGELCETYGVRVVPIDVPWGRAVDPSAVQQALAKHPDVRVVFATLCETSTGVISDVRAMAAVVAKTSAVLVVDAISGLGADELQTDAWGVDVVVAGSQKGLMLPPGLAFITLSDKAWRLVEAHKPVAYYFNLLAYRKAMQTSDTPFTPAISLVRGLCKALRWIEREGLLAVLARHRRLAEGVRAGALGMGLQLFAAQPSNALTAIVMPAGVDGERLVRWLRDRFGVWLAEGQAELRGKIVRVAHLGYMTEADMLVALSSMELGLQALGHPVTLGAGVRAAEEVFGRP